MFVRAVWDHLSFWFLFECWVLRVHSWMFKKQFWFMLLKGFLRLFTFILTSWRNRRKPLLFTFCFAFPKAEVLFDSFCPARGAGGGYITVGLRQSDTVSEQHTGAMLLLLCLTLLTAAQGETHLFSSLWMKLYWPQCGIQRDKRMDFVQLETYKWRCVCPKVKIYKCCIKWD